LLTLTTGSVKDIHEVVIKTTGGARGIRSEGTLQLCLNRPFERVYGHDYYPTVFNKAGALLYFIAGPFHPFVDGNKRTALAAITYFLFVNGYTFNMPKDFVEFTYSIAENQIRSKSKISKWIQKACVKNRFYNLKNETRLLMFGDKNMMTSFLYEGEKITLEFEKR